MTKRIEHSIQIFIILFLVIALNANVACAPIVTQTGSVAVWSDQVYSDIYIDGAYYGQTGYDWVWFDGVPVGTHNVKITNSGYYDWVEQIYVESGEFTYVEAILVQETSTGYISVTSYPSGADVYLDGYYQGITPIKIQTTTGTHQIELSKWDYYDVFEYVDVPANGVAEFSQTLEKTGSAVDYSWDSRETAADYDYTANDSSDEEALGLLFLLFSLFFFFFMIRGIRKARKKGAARKKQAKTPEPPKIPEPPKTPEPIVSQPEPDLQPIDTSNKLVTSSAFGYKGATINYKVKVENPTSEPISDVKVHLFVPDVFLLNDSEKTISMLEPCESKTVTFEIRPTGECGDCNVSGRVNYYDYSTKKRQETDLETKSLSVICPLLKLKEISITEWRNTIIHLVRTEETTREISIPAETLFGMVSRVIEDMNMFMFEPEMSSTPQMYNGVARFYGIGVKDLKYAAQIEVVGGTNKSRLIIKAWAETEEALIGFYHGILEEIEKRIQVKGLIDSAMVQNIYNYGDSIGTQVKDSFVYKSKVEKDDPKTCPKCGKEKGDGEKFCSGCGTKFE